MKPGKLHEELLNKLKVLNELAWENRAPELLINKWLDNFVLDGRDLARDRLHAMHLLSNLMYFGNRELRAALHCMYRELFRYPIIQRLRTEHAGTTDAVLLNSLFDKELKRTRFLGVGNPSESGVHLLYYFRQEADLPKSSFINTHEMFTRARPDKTYSGDQERRPGQIVLKEPDILHYVFLDDLCGSGDQAEQYSKELLEQVRELGSTAKLHYYVLFAKSSGIESLESSTHFDHCRCLFELDNSYAAFEEDRYFDPPTPNIDKEYAHDMCVQYGMEAFPQWPLGYKNGQLLLGLHHNTPDNTLPIIWSDRPPAKPGKPWFPIFRRYFKKYGW